MTASTADRIVAEALRWVIYGLHEKGNPRIRYVGYTANPSRRLRDHLYEGRRLTKSHPLYKWINSLLKRDSTVCMQILEEGAGDWKSAERKWIAHFGRESLFNATNGGDSFGEISKESRGRMREKLRKRVFTPEHRARISEAKRGKKRPDAARYLKSFMAKKSPEERSDLARKAQASITPEGLQRLREAGVANSKKRWSSITQEERAAISVRVREQMKRVWAQRKASRD